jgi:hypothetical protein
MAGNRSTKLTTQAQQRASAANPFLGASWGKITIGGVLVPGAVKDIDGAVCPEVWVVQKGISVSGGVTIWRGRQIAENIKITVTLPNAEAFANYLALDGILRPSQAGTKQPPAMQIVNPALNFARITRVSCRYVAPPKEISGLAWSGEISLIQYRPQKLAKVGPEDPPPAETENSKLADENAKLAEQARKL